MMRFLLVFLLGLSVCAYALELTPTASEGLSGITLEAEHIEFDAVSGNVIATCSVGLIYKGVTLNTEALYYSTNQSELSIPGVFKVEKDLFKIQADQLFYQFQTLSGTAYHFDALMDRIYIKGKKIIFSPDKIEVVHASFTTCSWDSPHYLVKSRTLYIYPELGFLVAFDNWVQVAALPCDVWLPTFVYGSPQYSILGTGAPIPQIGSTAREGAYIKDKLGYFFNPRSSGTFDFGYMSRLGGMVGFTHNLGINEMSQLGVSAHSVGKDGFEGGLVYGFGIPKNTKKKDTGSQFEAWMHKFSDSVLPLSRFTLQYTFGELINDSRVDKVPVVGVQFNEIPLGTSGVFFSGNTAVGRYVENALDEVVTDAWQTNLEGELTKRYNLGPDWTLGTGASFLGHWYHTGQTWDRVLSRFSIQWLGLFHPEVSFTKRVFMDGSSPFEFEQKYAVETDEIGLKLGHAFGDNAFALESDYAIDTQSFRTIDFVLVTHFHCWQTSLRWNTVTGQISFGVDLY